MSCLQDDVTLTDFYWLLRVVVIVEKV